MVRKHIREEKEEVEEHKFGGIIWDFKEDGWKLSNFLTNKVVEPILMRLSN